MTEETISLTVKTAIIEKLPVEITLTVEDVTPPPITVVVTEEPVD